MVPLPVRVPAAAPAYAKGKSFQFQLNPPEGSTYRYFVSSYIRLMAMGPEMETDAVVKLDMTVNYRISRDSDEFVLEMGFDKIHMHSKNGREVADADASDRSAGSNGLDGLLRKLKSATTGPDRRLTQKISTSRSKTIFSFNRGVQALPLSGRRAS